MARFTCVSLCELRSTPHAAHHPGVSQVPGATTYFGCVGQDHYAEELKKVAAKDGVAVSCRWRGAQGQAHGG